VSLLLWEGRSLTYVAQQAGHSVATLAKHYAGVIEELEEQPRVTASEAIHQARADVAGGSGGLAFGELPLTAVAPQLPQARIGERL
jgi:hypothetical protein